MSEYISREEAINALDNLCDNVCPYSKKQRNVMCGACPLGSAFDTIEELPAADVRPVVRGKWESVDDVLWLCSKCHYAHGRSNYCPNCGAWMEER